MSADEVEAEWAKRAHVVHRDLLELGDRVSPQLEGLDVHERAAVIRKHCEHIIDEQADSDREFAREEKDDPSNA